MMRPTSSRKLRLVFLLAYTASLICFLINKRLVKDGKAFESKTSQRIYSGDTVDLSEDEAAPYKILTKGKQAKGPVTRIALLGERNSGTRWIYSELNKCFNHTLTVTRDLVRYKHWFQHDDGRPHSNVLVISMFRDPYFWVEAMRRVPHHSPLHLNLEWQEFVTKPWTMPRPERDLKYQNETGPVCQQQFHYNEIISCVPGEKPEGWVPEKGVTFFSGHQPQYELKVDGSGEPYASIIDLRRDKILNFVSVAEWDWVSKVMIIRYEDLLQKGTADFVRQIEEITGVKATCPGTLPQDRAQRELDSDYIQWMNANVDWEVEGMIGYSKMEPFAMSH